MFCVLPPLFLFDAIFLADSRAVFMNDSLEQRIVDDKLQIDEPCLWFPLFLSHSLLDPSPTSSSLHTLPFASISSRKEFCE